MTPPRRKRRYRDLADNLYWNGSVYVYRRPTDKKPISLGADKRLANLAARRANRLLQGREAQMVERILELDGVTAAVMLGRFQTEYLEDPERRYAAKTLADYRQMIAVLRRKLGQTWMSTWAADQTAAQAKIADLIDAMPPRTGIRYKSLLSLFFRFCQAKGTIGFNPAAEALTKIHRVRRLRLSLEGFQAVRARAEPWFQHTMDLALQSLQRREEIAVLKFADVRDGFLPVTQQKTGAHIMIEVGAELAAAIAACRDELLSPFMVHRKPQKKRRGKKRCKEHYTQVWPEELSRTFAAARAASKFYETLPDGRTPPTFHEIRALGARLYEDAGIDPQALLGHRDEKTTKIYLDRHKVEWMKARAGLAL